MKSPKNTPKRSEIFNLVEFEHFGVSYRVLLSDNGLGGMNSQLFYKVELSVGKQNNFLERGPYKTVANDPTHWIPYPVEEMEGDKFEALCGRARAEIILSEMEREDSADGRVFVIVG